MFPEIDSVVPPTVSASGVAASGVPPLGAAAGHTVGTAGNVPNAGTVSTTTTSS